MIGLQGFHQPLSDPFRPFPVVKFLDRKRETVVGAVVNAKHAETGAMLIGMGKNDCGHSFDYN